MKEVTLYEKNNTKITMTCIIIMDGMNAGFLLMRTNHVKYTNVLLLLKTLQN